MTGEADKCTPDINDIKVKLEEIVSATTSSSGNIYNPLLTGIWLPWANHSLQGAANRPASVFHMDRYGSALRRFAVAEVAWAIPTSEALSTILSYGCNIVELGSGKGYWAALLDAAGGNVTAVDDCSWRCDDRYFAGTIEQDGAAYLRDHGGAADSTLFICWGKGCDMDKALDEFKGTYLAVVGEDPGDVGGCTWWPAGECFEDDDDDDDDDEDDEDDAPASLNNVMDNDDDDGGDDDGSNEQPEEASVQQQWRRICTVNIPKWEGIHDCLAIFQRI